MKKFLLSLLNIADKWLYDYLSKKGFIKHFGSTTVSAPRITPVNVQESTQQYIDAMTRSAPAIATAEKTIRSSMQEQAMVDLVDTLMGPQGAEAAAARGAAVDARTAARVRYQGALDVELSVAKINKQIAELETFDVEKQKDRLNAEKDENTGKITQYKGLRQSSLDEVWGFMPLGNPDNLTPEDLVNNYEKSIDTDSVLRVPLSGAYLNEVTTDISRIDTTLEWFKRNKRTNPTLEKQKIEKEKELREGRIANPDEEKKIRDLITNYRTAENLIPALDQSNTIIQNQLDFQEADPEGLEKYYKEKKLYNPTDGQWHSMEPNDDGRIPAVDVGLITKEGAEGFISNSSFEAQIADKKNVFETQITELETEGYATPENIEELRKNLDAAERTALETYPGLLDLANESVKRQAETGREIQRAAQQGEIANLIDLAPDVVDAYRAADEGSVALADLAKIKAESLINPTELSDDRKDIDIRLRELTDTARVSAAPSRGTLETGIADLLGQAGIDSSALRTTLETRAPGLLDALGVGAAESALLSRGGIGSPYEEPAAATKLLTAADLGRPAEAGELQALGQRLTDPLTPVRGRGLAGDAISDMATSLLDPERAARISPMETRLGEFATAGMDTGIRPMGEESIEALLGNLAKTRMAEGVRPISDAERDLGLSAIRGMDATLRDPSFQEDRMQARIGELIGGAGRLSDMEQRQIQQEMLALQQRQGRAIDTGAAAAVSGRMAEARRADLGQDLAQASALLGQQDALTQARIREQMQARGLGQQGAVSAAGLEAARFDDLLRQRALAQQGAVSAAAMETERQDQMFRQQALGQQAGVQAAQLESGREADLLRERALGAQAGLSAEQIDAALQQEYMLQQQLGSQALQQAGAFTSAQDANQLRALTSAGQLTAQDLAQRQSALQAAGSLESQRRAQGLQATGLAGDIQQRGFTQDIAAQQAQLQQLAGGAQLSQQLYGQDVSKQQMLAGLLGQQESLARARTQEEMAQTGQGMAALQQAMGMSKAITPDIGAFFGRPVSQGPGLSVLSAGQQQAMYGTTPQAVNPDAGVNLAMSQAANQAKLDAAAMSATGQAKAGMMSGFGNVLGSVLPGMEIFGGNCWVAREVYGNENPMWLLFREWMLNESPSWFRNSYIKYGERFAAFISNKPFVKKLIRKWMTSIVRKKYGHRR
jgi:hypothetical protein